MKKIGVLTGGGDCPGLNAVIRAVFRKAIQYNWKIIGIKNGWKGLVDGEIERLTDHSVSGILPKGGTIIKTSRTNPFKNPEDLQKTIDNIDNKNIMIPKIVLNDENNFIDEVSIDEFINRNKNKNIYVCNDIQDIMEVLGNVKTSSSNSR